MNCKRCNKAVKDPKKKFCSEECRNFWVSDLMIKKAKKAKKDFGNTYYVKKENGED